MPVENQRVIFGGDEVQHAVAGHLPGILVAGHLDGPPVGEEDLAVLRDEDPVPGVLDEQPVLLLGFPQRFLAALALGDVEKERRHHPGGGSKGEDFERAADALVLVVDLLRVPGLPGRADVPIALRDRGPDEGRKALLDRLADEWPVLDAEIQSAAGFAPVNVRRPSGSRWYRWTPMGRALTIE